MVAPIIHAPQAHPPGLMSKVENFLQGLVLFPAGTGAVAAAWVLGTYLWALFDCFPFLIISSPVPSCGKSTLAWLLAMVCRAGKLVTGVTDAVLFRIIDTFHPTVVIDEGESISITLRTLLNAGFENGARVPRCAGKTEVREWDIFCPKAVVAIRALPETIRTRGIEIRMRRARTSVTVRRRLISPIAAQLRDELEAWAAANRDAVAEAYSRGFPEAGLHGRDADLWDPILAIVSVAEPTRLVELQETAQQLVREKARRDSDTSAVRLLGDIKMVFEAQRVEKLPSERLLMLLRNLPESPWQRLSTHDLARKLREFDITPTQLWLDARNLRGYALRDFADAFELYVHTEPAPIQQRLAV
jgi:putative DNA primase/helicase